MGSAQKCKCGHVLTDHLPRAKEGIKIRAKCEWWDCPCKLFKPDGRIHTYGRQYNIVESTSPLIKNHNRANYIGELRDDGTIINR